ncbi:hypothetical protein Ahy_B01g053678 isoform C [Arachis hypogaea]|uniref:Uncharacterized protein n=1 Tax=Arachis hypogaea TaxID=3818 RepID=A0A445ASA5_ARAHY|nr:hypothetical protein Ahy_B01g053678 isoform C [Arachis hypogaea]
MDWFQMLVIPFQVVGDRRGAVFGSLVEAPLRPSNKKYQIEWLKLGLGNLRKSLPCKFSRFRSEGSRGAHATSSNLLTWHTIYGALCMLQNMKKYLHLAEQRHLNFAEYLPDVNKSKRFGLWSCISWWNNVEMDSF